MTATLNSEQYVGDTIRSVKNQTYDNIEHIFVDGGSTDKTSELVAEYAKTHNVKWIVLPGSSVPEALNKAMSVANGDFFSFYNSDDLLFPWAIDSMVTKFGTDDDICVMWGDELTITEDVKGSTPLMTITPPPWRWLFSNFIRASPGWWIFRRRAYTEAGELYTGLRMLCDIDYFIRLTRVGKCVKRSDVYWAGRKHGAALSVVLRDVTDDERPELERRLNVDIGTATPWKPAWWKNRITRVRLFAYRRVALLRIIHKTSFPRWLGGHSTNERAWPNFFADHRIRWSPVSKIITRIVPFNKKFGFFIIIRTTNPTDEKSPLFDSWRETDA